MLFAQNTTAVKVFSVNDSLTGDPYQPITGLGALVALSKQGGAFTVPTVTAHPTGMGNGAYWLPVAAADVDTIGSLTWLFSFNDGLHVMTETDQVVPALPGGPGELTNPERDAVAAAVLGLANGVDVGVSLAHAMMAIAAVLAGKTNVAGDTIVFRNWQDTKSRVTVKTNVSGRYQVTFDFS